MMNDQITAHPESADEVAVMIRKLTELAATEDGVLYYCITRDAEVAHKFHVFERYAGRQAFEDHVKQDLFQNMIGAGIIADVSPIILKPLNVL
jgi:quinol monooxygenase YgiN